MSPPPSLLNVKTPLWLYLSVVAFILLASWSASWVKDHYELVAGRPVRRWYGTGAYVLRPGTPGSGPVLRLRVLAWTDESTALPWLLVRSMAWVPADDDDPEPFWAPVTEFIPGAVRRFRPHLRGWLPVLFAHQTLPGGSS